MNTGILIAIGVAAALALCGLILWDVKKDYREAIDLANKEGRSCPFEGESWREFMRDYYRRKRPRDLTS